MYSERVWKKRTDRSVSGQADQDGPGARTAWPTKRLALTAGLLYLGVIIFGIFAQMARMDLIVPEDAGATVANILGSSGSLQLALVSDIAMCSCFVLLGVVSYVMFKKTHDCVAWIMLLLVVVSGAYAFYNLHNVIEAIQMVNGAGQLTVAEQEMVLALLNAHEDGTYIANVIGWGPWLVPLGYLGYRSGFVPKAIGFILIAGGIGLTAQGLQYFLLPDLGDLFAPGVVLSIIGEFAICAWFIYSGVRGNRFSSGIDERTKEIDPVDPR
ncbi:MAG: DUF4386 domain-containing protein [Methanomassiliicoccales archaeon]|nr:DUF4386 domain-containing protein [Methanomassiliicoccales archaeon]